MKNVGTQSPRRQPSSCPSAYTGSTYRLQGQRQNAVDALRRSVRRCLKHFGAGTELAILDVAARELGKVGGDALGAGKP